MKSVMMLVVLLLVFGTGAATAAQNYSIGAYYFPGWRSDYINWKDIKGLPGSRSPGKAWPDRVPLLGYYPEEEFWVAEKHIEWAAQYGINFFVYDWYWDGTKPEYDHALKNYLKAGNKSKLQFSLLWDNAYATVKNLNEFDRMVSYWIDTYFNQPTFYHIDGKPIVFIFSHSRLAADATAFGESVPSLLKRANQKAKSRGYKGIYFVATTNDRPDNSLEINLLEQGFNAYSGWNYALAKGFRTDDYSVMVDGYLAYYAAAAATAKKLPYIVPASPGYDERPWLGERSIVRNNPAPEKFAKMLEGAKALLDTPGVTNKILMIEAWNEFAEGAYIEPTKKWGFSYLEAIMKAFAPPPAKSVIIPIAPVK